MKTSVINGNKQIIKAHWLFLIPSIAGAGIFLMIPYLDVFRRAFTSTSGERFVGLDNFRDVLGNAAFRLAFANTFKFTVICIPLLLAVSLAIALFIYERPSLSRWMKPGLLMPMAVPVASVVLLWRLIFDRSGFLNGALSVFGFGPADWMNTEAAFWVLVISYIWKNLGYNVILWIAGLSTIPKEMTEAARVDGASELKIIRYITLPNLLPSIFVISILALLNSFKVFREAYLISGNYPHDSIYMIQHLFNNWFRDLSLGKMAAGAVIVSLILIVLIVLLERLWNREGMK